jgi:GTP cyclohydrolase II
MPDVFHWLGVRRIDRWVSMSNLKFDAMQAHGIEIGERVAIPDYLIPADARVEMDAKKAAGYFAGELLADAPVAPDARGRRLEEY